YGRLSREIVNLRQRLRSELLKRLRDKWDIERPVSEVELQLSGLKFDDEPGTNVPLKRLAKIIMTLPGTTVEEEFYRRNAAIDDVAAY
ncbi:hypothetical protein BJ875DRAFT_345861, partial [Amylocarpus encephaloides]